MRLDAASTQASCSHAGRGGAQTQAQQGNDRPSARSPSAHVCCAACFYGARHLHHPTATPHPSTFTAGTQNQRAQGGQDEGEAGQGCNGLHWVIAGRRFDGCVQGERAQPLRVRVGRGGKAPGRVHGPERDHGGREVLLDLLETALETTKHLAKLQPFPSKQRFRLKKFRGYRRNRADE